MSNRYSFQLKLIIMFVGLTIVTIFVTNYFIYEKSLSAQKEEIRKRLISAASLSALLIDAEEHQQILPDKSKSVSCEKALLITKTNIAKITIFVFMTFKILYVQSIKYNSLKTRD